jgi:hypothetical protein
MRAYWPSQAEWRAYIERSRTRLNIADDEQELTMYERIRQFESENNLPHWVDEARKLEKTL